MSRGINKDALNQKIEKAEREVAKAKRSYDAATAELKKLLDKRDALRSKELLQVVAESPLSYEEILGIIKSAGQKKTTCEDEDNE